ncbi:hypothetical protein CRYUN_Cryun01aG0021300 [Craigia yunnanensis]
MGTVDTANKDVHVSLADKKPIVVFVLGGPGSGKGSQCANIVQHFHYTHLSPEIFSEQKLSLVLRMEGKIVPSEVTIKLLQKAMLESGNDKFLIDGFPRNVENRAAFEAVVSLHHSLFPQKSSQNCPFFNCSEEEMEKRLLSRNQGREDDNIETIRKRFKVFLESSLPVIGYYKAEEKAREIDAAKPIKEVFEAVKVVVTPKDEKVTA